MSEPKVMTLVTNIPGVHRQSEYVLGPRIGVLMNPETLEYVWRSAPFDNSDDALRAAQNELERRSNESGT